MLICPSIPLQTTDKNFFWYEIALSVSLPYSHAMDKNQAFLRVLEHVTRIEIARHFGISEAAVSQWLTNGVPPERAARIERLVEGRVTKEELCPQFPWK